MATATSTKATQNGAAATDAAFKAATDAASAATDFARNATEAFVPSVEKATEQAQAYGDAVFAQAKKSGLALLDAYDAGLEHRHQAREGPGLRCPRSSGSRTSPSATPTWSRTWASPTRGPLASC